jgi:hypothetical protein
MGLEEEDIRIWGDDESSMPTPIHVLIARGSIENTIQRSMLSRLLPTYPYVPLPGSFVTLYWRLESGRLDWPAKFLVVNMSEWPVIFGAEVALRIDHARREVQRSRKSILPLFTETSSG